jgi:hypothetical protein
VSSRRSTPPAGVRPGPSPVDPAGAADEILNEGSRLTAKSRRLVTQEDGSSAAAPEAHTPTATAATETARATATTVTAILREPVTARGLCAGTVNLSEIRGCVVSLSYH